MTLARPLLGLTLGLIAAALGGCGGDEGSAADTEIALRTVQEPAAGSPRVTVKPSAYDYAGTLQRLYRALDRRDLTVFAVIDHGAGAQSVGSEMPPATVVIFGSPEMGTPLMLAEPRLAAELPLRAAVYVDGEGEVRVAVTSIASMVRAYPALEEERMLTSRMRDNLAALLSEVTGSEG